MPDSDEIFTAARKLAEIINKSSVYDEYRKSLSKVREKPEFFLRLQIFKEASASDAQMSFEQERAVSRQYTELIKYPDTAVFLANEEAFLKIYSDVLDIIDGACEIEMF